jgi:hypothetical protein
VDLFADYQEDAWPSRQQVLDLPPSGTGLGLDQPLAVVQAAAATMSEAAFFAMAERFCHGWDCYGDPVCECGAMGPNHDSVNWLRVDAHVTAEGIAAQRLTAAWSMHHFGDGGIDGEPAAEFLERVAVYG